MSHFTVLVTGDDVEASLAPYDENRETPRYLKRTKAQIIADGRREVEEYRTGLYAEYLADPDAYAAKRNNPQHLRYLREEFPKKLAWTDEQHYADEVRWIEPENLDADGAEWSECNPEGYWDYWRVGGRWSGHLHMRSGTVGHSEPLSWEWTFDGPPSDAPDRNTTADVARKGDVDLDETEPTFAVVHDGKWISRGETGWWGVLREEAVSEDDWPAVWRKVVESLDDDTRLTVVDCHV